MATAASILPAFKLSTFQGPFANVSSGRGWTYYQAGTGSKFAWSIIEGNNGRHVPGFVGAIRNICFPYIPYMENVYIQYNSPIPILLPVSMNHLAERGQMLARVLLLGFLADKFSCRRFVNLTDEFVSHRLGGHWRRVAFERAKCPRECHPFPFGSVHFIIGGKSINGDRWGDVYPLRVGINNHINILGVSGGWMGIVGRHQIMNRWSSCCCY